jgi:signal transduction histidine kinase
MADRRGTYFAFQGLLTAVLVLLFVRHPERAGWAYQFPLITAVLGGLLFSIRVVSRETLASYWFQTGLFLADTALSSLLLLWSGSDANLALIFSLIIFGTAITRRLVPTLMVAGLTTVLFLVSRRGAQLTADYWLKIVFLWVESALLAILSQDARRTQEDSERRDQGRLIEVERLSTLGQLAAEVAHRIKGPLTTITVNAEVLAHRLPKSSGALEELGEIREEALRCKEILKTLLDLGRIEEIDRRPLDLREPLRSALKAVETQCEKAGLKLTAPRLDHPLPVFGDHSLLHEAFAAILQNAVDAGRGKGSLRVSVDERRPSWWENGRTEFRVGIEDDGQGIAPEHLDRIFKAYFTTKGREGSGLGLSAALRILQKHDGTIEAYSPGTGSGARFVVSIPRR